MIRKIMAMCMASLMTIGIYAQETYTLQTCKELALQNNTKAQKSELALEAARQSKKEAFTKYFPSVSAMGVGFKATKPMMAGEIPIGALMGNPEMPPFELNMLKKGMIGVVSATQPVFAGGQIVNGNKLAKVGVEVAELQKSMSEDALLLTVEQYYWQIVTLKEKMKTIAEAESLLQQAYQDVNNSYQAGLVNKNELLKVELKQNELESNKLKLSNGLKLAKMVLAQYIGVTSDNFDVEDPSLMAEEPMLPVKADHESALQQRAEYRLLDKNIEANKLQVKMETGKNLPTVAIGAGWNYMNIDKNSPMGMEDNFGMGFVTISIPITNWWGGSHAIKKQKMQVKIAESEKQDTEELLLIQMQQLWNEVNEALAQVRLSEKAIDSAVENVRLNSDYYKAGTGVLTDLLDAQSSLQQARDQHTEALANYRIKQSKYKQVTGQP